MRQKLLNLLIYFCFFFHLSAYSTPFEFTNPNDSYYKSIKIDSISRDLPNQLARLIQNNHKTLNYKDVWTGIKYSDESPTDSSKVVLFYLGIEVPKSKSGGKVGDWNREHVWAKSKGNFGTHRGPGTDLHHLRPTSTMINSSRGSKSFDEGGKAYYHRFYKMQTENRISSDSFEPRDEVKGDVARILFYMAIRYGALSNHQLKIVDQIVSEGSKSPKIGKLSTLLEWHELDPVSDFEIERNNRIHHFQGNRNPFIDHPEWVELIWTVR